MHVGVGCFFQNLGGLTDSAVYEQTLSLVELAEPSGYDSVWSPEHHFSGYTMSPNVMQFLTWVAAKTERVQLGSVVMVLPWHDPVRAAEEVCVLDNLSRGRVVLGIGRGVGRIEFDGFRVPMGESRRRFNEYADALINGLENGFLEYDGEVYKQPRVEIRPRPYASFHGRTYASAVSPESFKLMAPLGVGAMVIAQKPWEKTEAEIANYRESFVAINGYEPPRPLLLTFVAVDEDKRRAEEMYEKHLVRYCSSTVDHYEFDNADLGKIEGYEYYSKLSDNIHRHGKDRFTRWLADLQVWGDPETVRETIQRNVDRLGAAGVIAVFGYGGMSNEVAMNNFRTFTDGVLPSLQADTDAPSRAIGRVLASR